MRINEVNSMQISSALASCPPLTQPSPQRDALWLVVQSFVCTRAQRSVTPLGSKSPVVITADYAGQELVGAMEWLIEHEACARLMSPDDLLRQMCGAATKGTHGSGRAARADAMHGVTHVPAGEPLRFYELDCEEQAAS